MKTLLKTLLVGVLFIGGCAGYNSPKLQEIIVSSGDVSISTLVRENGEFKHFKTVKSTTLSISGVVEQSDDSYIVHIQFSRNNKFDNSSQELSTSVMLKKNESIIIGGFNDDSVKLKIK